MTFSELLVICDLDIYYQKGLLDYHIKELCKSRILTKEEKGYALTSLGKKLALFFESIKNDYQVLFTAKEKIEGEIMKLNIEKFDKEVAEEVSLAKYGTKEEARNEELWSCGKRVPLKHMGSEWGKTFSIIARKDGRIIGVLYGNTIPMHVTSETDGKLAVVEPTKDKPVNRLEGEIFEIWVHPDYEGQGVERQLIEGFMEHMKKQGAVAILAERVLMEDKALTKAFEELDFQKLAVYHDFKKAI